MHATNAIDVVGRFRGLPIATALVGCVLASIPAARPVAYWLILENRPVELLTFILLLAGGVLGVRLAWRVSGPSWIRAFYAAFATGLLLTAMEEVAWGQQLFGFATPELLARINVQGETTLHNIK